MTDIIIAIDGPAGTGKSTVSRDVASALGMVQLDTGAMYRAITVAVIDAGIDPENLDDADQAAQISQIAQDADITIGVDPHKSVITLDGRDISSDIRTDRVTASVSAVSAVADVRERLVSLQRETVTGSSHGIVIEGRDIGTVVFPDARLKIFLTADAHVRAQRRARQNHQGNDQQALQVTEADLRERDRKDSERELSPLRAAPDAVEIDTTTMTQQQVVDQICSLARQTYPDLLPQS